MALFKASRKTSEELSQEQGPSIVQEKIDSSVLGKFLDGIQGLTASIFSTPATNTELSAAQKRQWADTQAKLFFQL